MQPKHFLLFTWHRPLSKFEKVRAAPSPHAGSRFGRYSNTAGKSDENRLNKAAGAGGSFSAEYLLLLLLLIGLARSCRFPGKYANASGLARPGAHRGRIGVDISSISYQMCLLYKPHPLHLTSSSVPNYLSIADHSSTRDVSFPHPARRSTENHIHWPASRLRATGPSEAHNVDLKASPPSSRTAGFCALLYRVPRMARRLPRQR